MLCTNTTIFILSKFASAENESKTPSAAEIEPSISKVFYSPNEDDKPNFDLPKMFYFKKDNVACYEGYVTKKFGNAID